MLLDLYMQRSLRAFAPSPGRFLPQTIGSNLTLSLSPKDPHNHNYHYAYLRIFLSTQVSKGSVTMTPLE